MRSVINNRSKPPQGAAFTLPGFYQYNGRVDAAEAVRLTGIPLGRFTGENRLPGWRDDKPD